MIQPRMLVARALQQSDDLVVVFNYQDAHGDVSRRVVSPYGFRGKNHFLGLCLTREEPRQFDMDRCSQMRIDLAMNYVMPVAAEELLALQS